MARLLTGLQSTGRPHLGNILGAIIPGIELSQKEENEAFYFIADLHSLTTIKSAELRKKNVLETAAAYLAFGFDDDKNVLYRQSEIKEINELTWYLNCFTPYPMLATSHAFKDKSENLSDVNGGLFNYPVLMSADILIFDTEIVPIGKDQKQHLEMCRDIAGKFNREYGEDVLVIPDSFMKEDVMIVPGVDGRKMSKSYDNYIDIFLPKKKLKKQVMNIVTDSKGLKDVKDPDSCNVYKIYSLLANDEQKQKMRENYVQGNYGYGHAKLELFELILNNFSEQRDKFNYFMENEAELISRLKKGEGKAQQIAKSVIKKVRNKVGFNW